MAKRGYSVTGIDVSESMINVARKRAVEEGLRIEFTINDIRDLEFKERFDAAYCLFNTLFTFTRNDDLINVMKGVNCSLKADGLFIVEVGNLWPLIAQGQFHNSTSKRVDEKAGWKRFRGDRTVIGPYNNIYYTESLTNYSREGVESKPEKATIGKRVVSVNEFDLLCRLTRFKIVGLYGSTDISKPIDNPDEIREIKEPYTSFVLVLTKC
jgi:SAM-dependent methyltransferase